MTFTSQGHLLVLKNFRDIQLNHALMEAGYVDHQSRTQLSSVSTPGASDHGQNLSISMTATVDTMGNLVLGKTSLSRFLILHLYFDFSGLQIFYNLVPLNLLYKYRSMSITYVINGMVCF